MANQNMQIPDLPDECESQRCHYQPYSWQNYEEHFQHAHPRRRNGRPDLLAFAHQMGLTNEEEDQITDDEEEDVQITDDEDPDDTDEEFPLDDEQIDDQPQLHPPVQALPQVPADVMEDLRSDLDQREAMYLMHRNAARNKFDPIPFDDNVPADPQIEVPAQIITVDDSDNDSEHE